MEQPAALTAGDRGLASAFYLLNATSLLEASIGVAWQAAFAHAVNAHVPLSRQALVFAGLWLVYTADRWLDARKPGEYLPTSYRHRFAVRHQRALLALWGVVLLSSLALAARYLHPEEWRSCLLLLAAALGYTALVQSSQPTARWFVRSGAKQVAVAALFASGVTLFVAPAGQHRILLAPTLAFFGVALFNLLVITGREHQHERAWTRATSHCGPCRSLGRIVAVALGAALAALAFAGLERFPNAVWPGLWGTLAASWLALLGLRQVAGKWLTTDACHVLADLALLVPPLTWLWL
jgi:hypothetical protein